MTRTLAHCALVTVLLFCAAMLPFAPDTDDSDDNFGRATVETAISRPATPLRSEQKETSTQAALQSTLRGLRVVYASDSSRTVTWYRCAQLTAPLRT